MRDEALELLRLRAQLRELGSTVDQLRQAGLDSAAAQLLLSRKRAQLDDMISRRKHERAASLLPRQR
ncbi:hypothetical protein MTX26_14225 [Bradyrhizobium sp. ISRA443]|nr:MULTISPECIES: hypothetical protein [unclassified Bradyrhizobium]WGR91592.1 hypothetical protein MTX20_24740 [Bradyrhizobium sp. ISRA435]WGS01897.1 hypothetical protein MTX23_14235 [Bradyrhizobium sp. ISRA436]WGS08783.1 hypothetical protein MTX18_14225 [Bradyrhizobium sp. ISRA437]WGS15671.1 hypothetical protein MTX26_14225 [Bradyrhizobium sp. ISRA443]